MTDERNVSPQHEELVELKKDFSLFRLAWKNVFTYAWVNIKMCFVFACLAFLICLFTSYNMGLAQRRQERIEQSISANYLYYNKASSAKKSLIESNIGEDYEYQTYKYYQFSDRLAAQGVMNSSFHSTNMVLEMNGKRYTDTEMNQIDAACFAGDYFTKLDLEEMQLRGYDSCLIGSEPEDASQAALSEILIAAYDLKTEDVLGNQISLYIAGESAPFFTGEVSGVVRKEFYDLSGHTPWCRVGMLLHPSHALFSLGDGNAITRHVYVLNDWLDIETSDLLYKSGITYVGRTFIHWIDALDNIVVLGNNLYIIIGTALAVALILTIFLMVGKYIKVFSRSSGILLTLGLEKGKLYGLLLIQLLIICMLTIPISFLMSLGGYYIINVVLTALNNVNMGISLARLALMFVVGIAAVLAIVLLFFAYAVWRIRKQTIKQFLSAEIN